MNNNCHVVRSTAKLASFAVTAVLGAAVVATSSNAAVVFSDLGPGNSYQANAGWVVSGNGSPVGLNAFAVQFTSPGNYTVSQIDIALTTVNGIGVMPVALYSNSGGALGTNIGSFSLLPNSGLPSFGSTSSALTLFPGGAGATLSAGAKYWIYINSGVGTYDEWNFNSVGATGRIASSSLGYANGQTLPAFDVLGTPVGVAVPEPAALMCLGAGLAGLGALRRRRKAA